MCNFSTFLLSMTLKANEEWYLFMVTKIIMKKYFISSEIKSGCGTKAIFFLLDPFPAQRSPLETHACIMP